MAAYVLKLGIAAAWFTPLASAERFADEPLDELELLPLAVAAALLELLELLDEHAASKTAAPAAATPNATRSTRGFRLPVVLLVELLKRFMRPRICHTGS